MSVPSNTPTGKYIVIEGIEAVGKSTVIQLLARELQAARVPVQIVAAPEQQDIAAQTIQRLVDDPRYPTTERTDTLLGNAVDSQSLETIRQTMDKGIICLADRSYLTTLVTEYYGQGNITDYNLANQISSYAASSPQPDLLIVLDAPVNALKSRVSAERAAALQESYLERVRAGYLWEARQRNLPVVYTTDAIDTVFHNVWEHVTALLGIRQENNGKPSADTRATSVAEVLAAKPPAKTAPAKPNNAQPDSSPSAGEENPSPKSSPDTLTIPEPNSPKKLGSEPLAQKQPAAVPVETTASEAELAQYVTDVDGPVYGFTAAAPTTAIVAAMAQLSRRGDDVRTTLLRELGGEADEISSGRSVQQLTGQYVVVEGASQLLTQKLQWGGGLAACVEQSPYTIAFDQKDARGHYRYYLPPQLKGKLRSQYIHTINQQFDTYSKLVGALTTHIRAVSPVPVKERDGAWQAATRYQALGTLRPLLPVAAKSTVGMYASSQSFENLSMHLLSDELPESRTVGRQLTEETHKAVPTSVGPTNKAEHNREANISYQAKTYASVRKLALELLPPNHAAESSPVNLVSYTPHNELDIIADILYEHSDLPLEHLQHEVANWPYQRKVDILLAYVGDRLNRHQRPGRALENVRYSFDLVCDYTTFSALQQRLTTENPEWQPLSPRLGYHVPKLVEETGLADAFDQCFDLSLRLYSELQAGGFPLEAQYATLLGHKLRWKVTYSAHEAFGLHELHTSPRVSSDHRKLVQQMHAAIAEVHPLLAEAMRFAE